MRTLTRVSLLAAALILLAGAYRCLAASETGGASAKEQQARRAKLSSELASLRLEAARQAVAEAEVRLKTAQEGLAVAQRRVEEGVAPGQEMRVREVALAAAQAALAKARADLAELQASAAARVTLSLAGADIKAALSKLFEGTGQSYVLDSTVAEGIPITVTLNNVEFEKALAAVCEAAGLQYRQGDGVWVISKRPDMAFVYGARLPVVGAMGIDRPMPPGELPGNIQFGEGRILRQLGGGGESLEYELPGAPKHPSFSGEDKLIDLDVKDMPLSEVAAKLSHKVPPPAQGEVPEGDAYGKASGGAFDSLEIIVPEAVSNLKVTAKIFRWPLGKVLDMLTNQTNLACSKEEVLSEPIHTKEGHAVFQAKTTKLYLVPKPELSVSGMPKPRSQSMLGAGGTPAVSDLLEAVREGLRAAHEGG